MKNVDIKRYQGELNEQLPKSRVVRRVIAGEYQKVLDLLREENESVGYFDLIEAFGTPEEMAKTLMQSPAGRVSLERMSLQSKRRKMVLCIVVVLIVLTLSVVGRTFWIHTEHGELGEASYGGDCNGFFIIDSPLTNSGIEWKQPWNHSQYQIEITNAGEKDVKVTVLYSKLQEPHMIVVPDGESRFFDVSQACYRTHRIAMSTLDGDIEGTIKVFVVQ